jgi:uncharacterized protein
MSKDSREFQVFVKPVGAQCNLSCQYCYYLEKSDMYQSDGLTRMPDSILEKYVIQLIGGTTDKDIFFSWHGGEPTLAGLDFFRRAVILQKKHKPAGRNIINGLQTNATLLNDDWCNFLSEEGFLVGVSIDGPERLHNKFRVSKDRHGSFKKTMGGYDLLRKHHIQPEILTVVNAENVNYPAEAYRFLKSLGSEYITFLPLVKEERGLSSGVSRISVPSESFGIFLSTIFDEWVSCDIGRIKIQIIEEAARTAFNQEHTLCIFKESCGGVPVVEHNGNFYSCDHYVNQEHLIGNINTMSISEMLESAGQIDFGMAKHNSLPQYCIDCEVIKMCNGECPKNRFMYTPAGEPGLNYLCTGYKRFFTHIRPFIDAISIEWSQRS